MNADRAAKKTVMQIGMDIFEQAMYDLFFLVMVLYTPLYYGDYDLNAY